MTNDIRIRAATLADDFNVVFVESDFSTPDAPLYVAYHPELPRAIAQGVTPEEAQNLLADVVVDHIAYLLNHNLPIPKPASLSNSVGACHERPLSADGYAVVTVGEGPPSRIEPFDLYVVAPHQA
jgi:predicted RNase H-like HicB family nuclease